MMLVKHWISTDDCQVKWWCGWLSILLLEVKVCSRKKMQVWKRKIGRWGKSVWTRFWFRLLGKPESHYLDSMPVANDLCETFVLCDPGWAAPQPTTHCFSRTGFTSWEWSESSIQTPSAAAIQITKRCCCSSRIPAQINLPRGSIF